MRLKRTYKSASAQTAPFLLHWCQLKKKLLSPSSPSLVHCYTNNLQKSKIFCKMLNSWPAKLVSAFKPYLKHLRWHLLLLRAAQRLQQQLSLTATATLSNCSNSAQRHSTSLARTQFSLCPAATSFRMSKMASTSATSGSVVLKRVAATCNTLPSESLPKASAHAEFGLMLASTLSLVTFGVGADKDC